jgi:predicted nucleic-acid-binding Zn-ribbon protein
VIVEKTPPFITIENNPQVKLLTILFDYSDLPIEEVYFTSINIVNKFLSRISLLGYCASEILTHIITTIDKIDVGVPFKVLSTDILHSREFRFSINKSFIDKVSKFHDEYLEDALSFLWKALSTDSLEEKIIMLSACLEKLGSIECEEFTKITCHKCKNEEYTSIKATKRYLKELLKSYGASQKQVNDFLDRDRNKIAHGGGKRDIAFYSDLKKSILNIQHLIVEIMSNRFNADLVNSTTSVIDMPFAVYQFEQNINKEFIRSETYISSQSGISKVKNMDEKSYRNVSVKLGLLDIHINRIESPHSYHRFPTIAITSLSKILLPKYRRLSL